MKKQKRCGQNNDLQSFKNCKHPHTHARPQNPKDYSRASSLGWPQRVGWALRGCVVSIASGNTLGLGLGLGGHTWPLGELGIINWVQMTAWDTGKRTRETGKKQETSWRRAGWNHGEWVKLSVSCGEEHTSSAPVPSAPPVPMPTVPFPSQPPYLWPLHQPRCPQPLQTPCPQPLQPLQPRCPQPLQTPCPQPLQPLQPRCPQPLQPPCP